MASPEDRHGSTESPHILELVETLIGRRPDGVRHVRTLGSTIVHEATVGGTSLFVKQAFPERIAGEVWCYATAAGAGVPVPVTVAHAAEDGVLVTERVPGVPLSEVAMAVRRDCLLDLGRCLSRLHAVPADGYGYLVESSPDGVPALGTHASQRTSIEAAYDADLRYLRKHDVVDDERSRTLTQLIDHELDDLVDQNPPVFLHGDLSDDHVYCQPATRRVSGLIDFAGLGGEAVQDVDWFGIHRPSDVAPIAEGHGLDPRTVERRLRLYTATRLIGEIRWCHFHGHARTLEKQRTLIARALERPDHEHRRPQP